MKYKESSLEKAVLGWLEKLGYQTMFGPDISPEPVTETNGRFDPFERMTYDDVVLEKRLERAINRLNPEVPESARIEALRKVLNVPNRSPKLETNNEIFHDMLINGVDVEYKVEDGRIQGDKVWLIDRQDSANNDWLAVNQFRIIEGQNNRVPDVVVFVNGLPLAVFELKNPAKERATIKHAFRQFRTYKREVPSLFAYNELLVISDGVQARCGTITSPWEWFLKWRSIDGKVIAPRSHNETKVLVKGIFDQDRLLDLVTNFVTFHDDRGNIKKIVSGYHQYFATNKALEKAREATDEKGDQRIGVIWHTQGSGKSLTMTFFAGKLIKELNNPTVVVITDRNDLDDQLFNTFVKSKNLLRQSPKQVQSREDLKEKLDVASGGVIFTTVQKFLPEDDKTKFPTISERRNIVVIADEAHRSQYGFQAKLENGTVKYGYAKYIRDALPNASFIGFTATPIALKDKNTVAVFGDVIDTYDISRAVQDEATVPIYYEARLARIGLDAKESKRINREFEDITAGEESTRKERIKARWARLEKMVGSEKRLCLVAKDIVSHFEERLNVIEGKGLIVTMSRRIAVDVYTQITKLRPDWHSDKLDEGKIKVVMSGSASDPQEYQPHIRNKRGRDRLAERMKNPDDELKLAIVCDMWLTGFDVPSLHTMYVDKPMNGHSLMQAIARVNRVYKDKQAGLIVDYLGIASELQKALSYYTKEDRKLTGVPQNEAVQVLKEKYEVVKSLFHRFEYMEYFEVDEGRRTEIITEAIDFILSLEDGAERYKKAVSALSQAFSIAVPHEEALKIREEVAFFQAVKAGIIKLEPDDGEGGPTEADYDAAIKQILSNAIVSDEVLNIYEEVGIEKPEIGILSEEFLREVQDMEHKNLAFEILKKLLNDSIKEMSRKNIVASKTFLEMLENTIKKYQDRTISSAEVIAELVSLAKEIQKEQEKGKELGLSEEEVAFYDALAENESAVRELGNEVLREMAKELLGLIQKNATIDWTKRKDVQAKLRIYVKKLLKKYNYPPDKQEKATKTVLDQAELFAEEWSERK